MIIARFVAVYRKPVPDQCQGRPQPNCKSRTRSNWMARREAVEAMEVRACSGPPELKAIVEKARGCCYGETQIRSGIGIQGPILETPEPIPCILYHIILCKYENYKYDISADPSQQGERVRGAVPLSFCRDHQSQCPRPVAVSTGFQGFLVASESNVRHCLASNASEGLGSRWASDRLCGVLGRLAGSRACLEHWLQRLSSGFRKQR